jgi:hypothetical protein
MFTLRPFGRLISIVTLGSIIRLCANSLEPTLWCFPVGQEFPARNSAQPIANRAAPFVFPKGIGTMSLIGSWCTYRAARH